jgi:hypothetical protein
MKKLIIAAIVLTNVFLACKKEDRVCSCSVTKTGTATTTSKLGFSLGLLGNVNIVDTTYVTQINETNQVDRTYKDVTKKQMKNSCTSYTEPYNEMDIHTAPPQTLTTVNAGTRTYDCKIK